MPPVLIRHGVPLAMSLLGAGLVWWWLSSQPADAEVRHRLPEPPTTMHAVLQVDLAGEPVKGPGKPGDPTGAWPRFRGPKGDGISTETTPLLKTWDAGGPPKLWNMEIGEGYAAPVIRDGKMFLMDYDTKTRHDVIRCLSLDDGQEIWRRGYRVPVSRDHGYSRTVPALEGQYVVAMGPKCHVTCVDAETGKFIWGLDLVRDYGTTVPPWYAGQCILIDGDRVILGVGGTTLVMAVDLATGKVLWKSPNPRNWAMTHVSVVPMTIGGKKTYIYCGSGGVAGVSADDGAILWDYTDWKVSIATVATPLVLPEDRIFMSGGYGAGSMMLKLVEESGKIIPRQLFRLPPEIFGAEQHTPIFFDGHIYGVIPGGQFICLGLDGKQVWASGGKKLFGLGGYILADGAFWVFNDTGKLTVIEATPAGYRELASTQVFTRGREAWGPPAIANGRLILRDLTRMACLDVRKK